MENRKSDRSERNVLAGIALLSLSLLLTISCGKGVGWGASTWKRTDTLYGIDVSHHNSINWNALGKEEGISFAYVKVTEGATFVDPMGSNHIRNASSQGMKVGAYHFFPTRSTPAAQWENFRKHNKGTDLIPVIDFETVGGLSYDEIRKRLKTLASLMEEGYGVKPMIYTSASLYNKVISADPYLRSLQLWVGHPYGTAPLLSRGRVSYVWQYSAIGQLSGAKGVDLNMLVNMDIEDLMLKK